MANDQKVSGSIKGNKLNISITSSQQQAQSKDAIKPIESSATKVKSIADVSTSQQKNTLNKKAVKQESQQSASGLQELELLRDISLKLSTLNENIVSVKQEKTDVKNDSNKENSSNRKLDEEIFTSNFSESIKNSFKSLLDDSSFKTKMNTMMSDIYANSTLLKQEDLDSLTTNIETTISENSYNINNSDKASNQFEQMTTIAETIPALNENIKMMTSDINSQKESVDALNKSTELMVESFRESSANSLNKSSSDPEIKNLNETLLSVINDVKNRENMANQNNVDSLNGAANIHENNNRSNENSIDRNIDAQESKFAAIDAKSSQEDEIFNADFAKRLEEMHEFDERTADSLDELLEERKQSSQKKESFHAQKKQAMETNKKNFSSIIKNSVEKIGGSIKKVGKATSLAGAGSAMKNIFSKPTSPKASELGLMKTQKTVSGRDNLSPMRDFIKNANGMMLGKSKSMSSSMSGKGKTSIPGIGTIIDLLSGFSTYYKKMTEEARQREIYKLRFGEEKKDDGMFSKLLNALKGRKSNVIKEKEQKKKDGGGLGIFGWILGLLGGAFGIFKGGLTGMLWGATKWVLGLAGKALWAVTKWIGGLLGKALWWAIKGAGKLLWGAVKWIGGIIGNVFKGIWSKLSGVFGKLFNGVKGIFGKLAGKFTGVFKGVFGKVSGSIGKIFGKLTGVFKGVFGKIFGKLGGILGKLGGPLMDKLGDLGGKILDKFGGKAGKLLKNIGGKFFKGGAGKLGKLFKGGGKFLKGGMNLAKGLFKGGGGKAAAKLAGKGLAKFGLKAGLRAGAGALKAIPGLGAIATVGMAAFDAVDGWKNAASISGKDPSKVTTGDKVKAAGASVLSGLTFGLVSPQKMFKGINAIGNGFKKLGGLGKKALKYSPVGLAATGAKKLWNWFTKPKKKGEASPAKKTAKAIGNIGKKLFKWTPAGMAASLGKKLWKNRGKIKAGAGTIAKKGLNIGKKLFKWTPYGMAARLGKSLWKNRGKIKAGAGTIAKKAFSFGKKLLGFSKPKLTPTQLASLFGKKVGKLNKNNVLAKLLKSKFTKFGVGFAGIAGALKLAKSAWGKTTLNATTNTNSVTKAVNKISNVEKAKVEMKANAVEKAKTVAQAKEKKFEILPDMIKTGIAGYFDRNKLRMDLKTGEVSVLPLGPSDIASKV